MQARPNFKSRNHTVCPRSSDRFYMVTYYIKWVTTSWTHNISLVEPVLCIKVSSDLFPL